MKKVENLGIRRSYTSWWYMLSKFIKKYNMLYTVCREKVNMISRNLSYNNTVSNKVIKNYCPREHNISQVGHRQHTVHLFRRKVKLQPEPKPKCLWSPSPSPRLDLSKTGSGKWNIPSIPFVLSSEATEKSFDQCGSEQTEAMIINTDIFCVVFDFL